MGISTDCKTLMKTVFCACSIYNPNTKSMLNFRSDRDNLQVLGDLVDLPGINLHDSFRFRTGQLHFLHKLASCLKKGENNHLGVFVPGYGKTITALASFVIAKHLGKAQKLIVFVPRGNLRDQYADPIELSRVLRNLGSVPLRFCTADSEKTFLKNSSTDIIITTYQYACGKSGNEAIKKFAEHHSCMFVYDEVHHLSDEGTWAIALGRLEHSCSIALSGTPIRSDNKSLFGVPFEIRNGNERFYKALHEVQLRDAHEEGGILKRVSTNMIDYKIKLRNIESGDEIELSLSQMQEMADSDQDIDAFLARKKMRFHSVYLDSLLRPAFVRFQEKRNQWLEEKQRIKGYNNSFKNHQMLIIAMSNNHSAAILEFVKQHFPEFISARIGQDIPAQERLVLLQQYRNGLIDIMVQVDMIGEGTDIKPISIIVKADLVRAISKTMQQIFRGMRYYTGFSKKQNVCDLFTSNDAALSQIFDWLLSEQQIGIKLSAKREIEFQQSRTAIESIESWVLADVQHKGTETLDWELFPDKNSSIKQEELIEEHIIPPSLYIDISSNAIDIISLEQQLRQECSQLAVKLSLNMKSQGMNSDVKGVHFESKKKFLKSQDQMNLQELEDKRNWLMKCLERGRLV